MKTQIKYFTALILIATMPVVAMLIGNCTSNPSTHIPIEQTDPLTEGVWYGIIAGEHDTTTTFRVLSIDVDRGIFLYDGRRIVPIPAPALERGSGENGG